MEKVLSRINNTQPTYLAYLLFGISFLGFWLLSVNYFFGVVGVIALFAVSRIVSKLDKELEYEKKSRQEETIKYGELFVANCHQKKEIEVNLTRITELKDILSKNSLDQRIAKNKYESLDSDFRLIVRSILDAAIKSDPDLTSFKKLSGVLNKAYAGDRWRSLLNEVRERAKKPTVSILHADDCDHQLRTVGRLLSMAEEDLGDFTIKLIQESDGISALARFNEEQFDIVITDQQMGGDGKDGNVLARNIRKNDSEVPIIVRSGSSREQLENIFRGMSVNYLDKNSSCPLFLASIMPHVNRAILVS